MRPLFRSFCCAHTRSLSATMTMITRPVGSLFVHTALTCESVKEKRKKKKEKRKKEKGKRGKKKEKKEKRKKKNKKEKRKKKRKKGKKEKEKRKKEKRKKKKKKKKRKRKRKRKKEKRKKKRKRKKEKEKKAKEKKIMRFQRPESEGNCQALCARLTVPRKTKNSLSGLALQTIASMPPPAFRAPPPPPPPPPLDVTVQLDVLYFLTYSVSYDTVLPCCSPSVSTNRLKWMNTSSPHHQEC